MNVNELITSLKATFEYNLTTTRHEDKVTPMAWGPPGIGKSDAVYQVADNIGYEVVELRLNSLNPVDVRGFPYRNEATGKGEFALPYYFPSPGENAKKIIFLDEINTALPSNQVTAYELCQNYSIGGKKLPNETLIVCAGNREDDGGATYEMPAPLANRLQHFTVLPSREAFVKYGIDRGLQEGIIGFIQFKPTLLHAQSEDKAYPTPRSWTKLSHLTKHKGNYDFLTVASLVGEGTASEFMAYLEVKDKLPDIDEILDNGIPFKSEERSVMYSFVTSLMYRLNADHSTKRVRSFMHIINHIPDELQSLAFHMFSNTTIEDIIDNREVSDEFFKLLHRFN